MIINDSVNIKKEAYNLHTKNKLNPGTKFVMMVDDDVVMQFNSKQSMDQYKYNMGKNPNAFMGTFMKVTNGTIVPLNEDTIKTDKGWTNKGKSGKTHGYFKSKKDADAQRKAMFASGYKSWFNIDSIY